MAFSEPLKAAVRRRAFFSCCVCHAIGVEVHHIVPQEEDGPDTEDNAAPLCPSCHELWGSNPAKRKAIREMRDFWYELCERRHSTVDPSQVEKLCTAFEASASKQDLEAAVVNITQLVHGLGAAVEAGSTGFTDLARLAGTIATTPLVARQFYRMCVRCGKTTAGAGDYPACPHCHASW